MRWRTRASQPQSIGRSPLSVICLRWMWKMLRSKIRIDSSKLAPFGYELRVVIPMSRLCALRMSTS